MNSNTPERGLGGVFVWALEGLLMSLVVWASRIALIALGLVADGIAYEWVVWIVFGSSLAHVASQTAVASWRVSSVLEENSIAALAHKTLARAHCSIVFFSTVVFATVWLQAQTSQRWANIFFSSAPANATLAGAVLLATLMVTLLVAVAGAFAATPVGTQNALFFFSALWLLLAILYPLVIEIGEGELFLCSSTASTLAAIFISNSVLLVSYLLFILDVLNAKPLGGGVDQQGAEGSTVRIYNFIHSALVSIFILVYSTAVRNTIPGVWVLLFVLAVLGALSSIRAWPKWETLNFFNATPVVPSATYSVANTPPFMRLRLPHNRALFDRHTGTSNKKQT